jgi:hypothetical protein
MLLVNKRRRRIGLVAASEVAVGEAASLPWSVVACSGLVAAATTVTAARLSVSAPESFVACRGLVAATLLSAVARTRRIGLVVALLVVAEIFDPARRASASLFVENL